MVFRYHRGLKYAPSDMLEKKWNKIPDIQTPETPKFVLTKADYHYIAYGIIQELNLGNKTK